MLSLFAMSFVLFVGISTVQAQAVVSQQQIQQKLDHNLNADQLKIDQLASATHLTDDNVLNAKNDAASLKGGYPPIPGFTYSGDPTTDANNYAAAKAALTPAQIQAIKNDPVSTTVIKAQNAGATTVTTINATNNSNVTPQ